MGRKMPIFYSALLLTGVNLLLRLVSTSFQVYLSGRIGAAGIGLLQLVLSVSALSMTASMAGIRTTAMYLTAEELGKNRPGAVKWVLSGCFTYSIIISVTICLGVNLAAPLLAKEWVGDPRTADAIRLFAAFLPVVCLCGVMTGYFTAANRIGTLAAVEIGEQMISLICTMLLLSFWAGSSPYRACISVIFGSGLSACVTLGILILLRARTRGDGIRRIPISKRLLNTALPLALADDLKAGISTTENLMVPKRLALYGGSVEPLAAFGTVCGMVFPVLMFPAAIIYALAELMIPELARCNAAGSHGRIQYLVSRSLRLTMLYGCALGGLMLLVADKLCMLLYKSPDAGYYLRLYSPMIPMIYCDAITDAMTKGLGQQKACVRYNIITSAMDVIFLYILLPKYGMQGYLWSFLITHLVNFLLSLNRLLRITEKQIPIHIPLFALGATAASVLIASAVSNTILSCLAFMLILGCALFLLGILKKNDIAWINGLWHSR